MAFLKRPVRLLKAISDYRGTVSAAPNFAYDLIARRVTPEQLADLDLSTWVVALNGAEPVRRRHHRADQRHARSGRIRADDDASRVRHGRGDADGHGQSWRPALSRGRRGRARTEPLSTRERAARSASSVPVSQAPVSMCASSTPKPCTCCPTTRSARSGCAVRALPAATTTVPTRRSNNFVPTPPTATGPILRTGDLGLLHEGELYVTGRSKDLLIVNGRNLYPQDIEEFVQDVHPALAEFTRSRGFGRRQRRRTPRPDPGRQAPRCWAT